MTAGDKLVALARVGGVAGVLFDGLNNLPATPQAIASAVWAQTMESGYSAESIMRLNSAILLSKVSGAGTGAEVFRDIADTKNRVTASVDAQGNRTAITLDPT